MSEMPPSDHNGTPRPHIAELQTNAEQLHGRLGVLHKIKRAFVIAPDVQEWGAPHQTRGDHYYVETVGDERFADVAPHLEVTPAEANTELQEVEANIGRFGEEEKTLPDPWHAKALALLAQAERTADEATSLLVGAFVCSHRSNDPMHRLMFLEEVYSRGLAARMARACGGSRLVHVERVAWRQNGFRVGPQQPVVSVSQVAAAAPLFTIERSLVEQYASLLRRDGSPESGNVSARELQQELRVRIATGHVEEELRNAAAVASSQGYKVAGLLRDIAKDERFALQQYYIAAQIKAVFGPGLTETPLAKELVARRMRPVSSSLPLDPRLAPIYKLEQDFGEALENLSSPVTQKYAHGPADSPEYKATERFRELKGVTKQCYLISRHVMGPQAAYLRLQDESTIRAIVTESTAAPIEIWSQSEDGAALPGNLTDMLTNIVKGVGNNPKLGSVTAEELFHFAHTNRRMLLGLATRNIADLPVGIKHEHPVVVRNERGEFAWESTADVRPKWSLEQYASVTLDCVALKEAHPSTGMLTPQERAQLGTSYLDQLIVIYLQEAFTRGIFDIAAGTNL
jgi:hypothetical protein